MSTDTPGPNKRFDPSSGGQTPHTGRVLHIEQARVELTRTRFGVQLDIARDGDEWTFDVDADGSVTPIDRFRDGSRARTSTIPPWVQRVLEEISGLLEAQQ